MDNFKISLKASRVNAGYTAKQAGELIGKTEKTILNWENAITSINADDFYKLCKIYEINPDYVKVPIIESDKDDFFSTSTTV